MSYGYLFQYKKALPGTAPVLSSDAELKNNGWNQIISQN